MNHIKQSHLILERGQVVKLQAGREPILIDCSRGAAWVTASKDPQDYVLCSGQRIELPAGSAIVIEGLEGRLEIDIKRCA